MSESTKAEHPVKETSPTKHFINSSVITTTLTCAILIVILAVCLRPTSDTGEDATSNMLVNKLTELEDRIGALDKELKDTKLKYENGWYTYLLMHLF